MDLGIVELDDDGNDKNYHTSLSKSWIKKII